MTDLGDVWVPEACILPTVDRPLRLAEFDDLFGAGLMAQTRVSPHVLRWSLDPQVEDVARNLTARETQCCSFFTFTFTPGFEALHVDIEVPAAQVKVLDALAARAAAGMATV